MSEPELVTFTLFTGEDFDGIIEVINENTGSPQDLSGSRVWLAVKSSPDDTDAAAALFLDSQVDAGAFDFSSASSGKVYFIIGHTLTDTELTPGQSYEFACKIKLATGKYKYPTVGKVQVRKGMIQAT